MSRPAFRRARHLVSYWEDGELLVHNYATGVRVAVRPETPAVLDFFHRWRTSDEIRDRFDASEKWLRPLLSATLLERSDRPTTTQGDALARWQHWNPVAGFFHMATRGSTYMDPIEGDRALRRKARVEPLPPPIKRFPGATRHPLPRLKTDRPLSRVLLERRTWRTFSTRPLPLAALGDLLGWTNGVQQWATVKGQGELPLKTSPSGGARHPLEMYVCARRVEGLRSGIYHYASDRHRLELVSLHPRPVRVRRYLPQQFWYAGAPALVFFTAVFSRYLWKYTSPRAYRAVLIEAGHQCQTFCLAATDLGLAPFCTMSLADAEIEADLGIDGASEAVIYAAGVGVRPQRVTSPSRPAGYPPLKVRANPWLLDSGRIRTPASRRRKS
ncbi:MAG: SagB family peptide dehydrogenase [Vicinamibacterales bacterium]